MPQDKIEVLGMTRLGPANDEYTIINKAIVMILFEITTKQLQVESFPVAMHITRLKGRIELGLFYKYGSVTVKFPKSRHVTIELNMMGGAIQQQAPVDAFTAYHAYELIILASKSIETVGS